jgi:outer membrane receptor for ferrienterochelin and colicin
VNSAVYYEDWSGIQQTVTETCGFSYTGNAGSAGVYGAEVEVTGRVTPEITLSNSAGYTHASISSAPAGSSFFAGEKIQDVPSWSNTTSINYTHALSRDYDLVARATNQYTDSMIDVSYGLNKVPARDLIDVRAGLTASRYSIFFYIDNLTDRRTIIGNSYSLSFNPSTFNRALTAQPRTFGLDLNYRFGDGGGR